MRLRKLLSLRPGRWGWLRRDEVRTGNLRFRRPNRQPQPPQQIGYVVAGEIDLIMEQMEPVRLGAGCSCYVAPNIKHGIVTHMATRDYDPDRLLYTCS